MAVAGQGQRCKAGEYQAEIPDRSSSNDLCWTAYSSCSASQDHGHDSILRCRPGSDRWAAYPAVVSRIQEVRRVPGEDCWGGAVVVASCSVLLYLLHHRQALRGVFRQRSFESCIPGKRKDLLGTEIACSESGAVFPAVLRGRECRVASGGEGVRFQVSGFRGEWGVSKIEHRTPRSGASIEFIPHWRDIQHPTSNREENGTKNSIHPSSFATSVYVRTGTTLT
jgi:hypothetical protein